MHIADTKSIFAKKWKYGRNCKPIFNLLIAIFIPPPMMAFQINQFNKAQYGGKSPNWNISMVIIIGAMFDMERSVEYDFMSPCAIMLW